MKLNILSASLFVLGLSASILANDQIQLPDEKAIQQEIDLLIDESGKVSEKNAKKTKKYIEKGIKLYDKGKLDKALVQYKKALTFDPLSSIAHYEIGMTYYFLGDYPHAFESVVRSLTISPGMEAALIMKANVLDDMGYKNLAVETWNTLVEIHPESYMAWLNKGITDVNLGKYADAEAAFKRARDIDPGHPSAPYFLVMVSGMQGFNYDELKYIDEYLKVGQKDHRLQKVKNRQAELTNKTVYVNPEAEIPELDLLVQLTRFSWRDSEHKEAYPEERGYRPSLKEELAVADASLGYWQEKREELGEPVYLLELEKLIKSGYFEAAKYVELQEQLGATDLQWGVEHKQLIEEYKEKYL